MSTRKSKKVPKLPANPMQPVIKGADNVPHFRGNAIVRALLDRDTARGDGGLNWIAKQDFTQEDQEQFAQLIGYSIRGYHELSYVSDESCAEASLQVEQILPGIVGGCRDLGCAIHGGPLFSPEGLRIK